MQGYSSFAEMQGRYEIVDFVSALFITSGHNVQKWKGKKDGINAWYETDYGAEN